MVNEAVHVSEEGKGLAWPNANLTDTTLSQSEPDELDKKNDDDNNAVLGYATFNYNEFLLEDGDSTTTSQDDTTTVEDKKRKRKVHAFSRNAYAKKRRKKLGLSKLATSEQSMDSSCSQESEESGSGNKTDQEMTLTGDLGKGKRKRFQNVRMVPIEEIVKSPNRKK